MLRYLVIAASASLYSASANSADNPLCKVNRDSVALVVGNKAYQETIPVPYAHNDAEAIKKFLIDKLCYRPGNIQILKDAGFNELRRWLGRADNPKGRLWKRARKGRSNIFVFYSGHGVPDVSSKRAYLLPVDADPNHAEEGYGLDQLERNLGALNRHIGPKHTVTLVLDACFSGQSAGGTLQKHSGSFTPALPSAKGIIRFTAASANQLAYWDERAKHGLFTSVFLDAVSGKADAQVGGNKDGRIDGRELAAYIADQVTYKARSLHGREQIPILPDAEYIPWQLSVTRPAAKKPAASSAIAADYQASAAIGTTEAWEIFLTKHGQAADNFHVRLARAALNKLKRTKVAVGTFPDKGRKKAPALKPGDGFKDCPDCPSMVVVPAGSYRMGSPKSEKGRKKHEGPQHRVTIAQAFAVGKYEITRGQFAAFVKATGHNAGNNCRVYERGKWITPFGRSFQKPGYMQDSAHPAVCINWSDAKAYVRWLGGKTGKDYRLLTEAEWEYAARAGTTTPYSFGKSGRGFCRYANAADQSTSFNWRNKSCSDGAGEQTSKVGRYRSNGFSLHDMHGNVWEWVEDCWKPSYKDAPADGAAQRWKYCNYGVVRGGSWINKPVRLAARSRRSPDERRSHIGFRVARSLSD